VQVPDAKFNFGIVLPPMMIGTSRQAAARGCSRTVGPSGALIVMQCNHW
jgi:hypothetical protein